jgi:LmbE family N-acetylglucosaminyl deacetylase
MSRVLVISPHPDDESIGCGGSLRKHVVEGDEVQVIFLTSGEAGGHDGKPPEATALIREQEAREAADILGVGGIEFWRQRDGAVRATRSLVERLRQTIEDWNPGVLYAPHARESHPDHRAGAYLVRRAVRSVLPSKRPTVLMFEVWTPMPRMDQVVDISPYIHTKLAAIRAHKSQCAIMRYDDAAQGLSRYRGEMHSGWPAAQYAEIFVETTTGAYSEKS